MEVLTLADLALTAVSGVASIGIGFVVRFLNDRAARGRLDSALARAAGQALMDPQVRAGIEGAAARAARSGANYVVASLPDTVVKLGVPVQRLGDMVLGEMGKIAGSARK